MTDDAINQLTSLDNIDPDTYRQAEAYIQQLLFEKFPDRDFGVGRGLYWLTTVPGAALAAAQLANARLVSNSLNLGAIRQFPEQASTELADLLLSNYYVSRKSGTNSTGVVTYIVSIATTYIVQAGALLRSGDLEYEVTETIYAYAASDQVQQSSDRLLQARTDGNYQFTVPVRAVAAGQASTLPRGTTVVPVAPPPGFVRALTATDVTGGTDEQSLVDLIAEIPSKFAAATWGSRSTIRSLINDLYPDSQLWVTGMGDPELLRDRHNPMGISSGGYTDVWVAPQRSLTEEVLELEAELVDVQRRTWRVTIGRDAAAGIYNVTDVQRAGGSPLEITNLVRGYAIPTSGFRPSIFAAEEAAFSSYQTLVLEFTDVAQDESALVLGYSRTYQVGVLRMSNIKELSEQLLTDQKVGPFVNPLIRGVVPCVTSISMVVRLLDADYESSMDVTGMKEAILSRVHSIGLGYGVLSSSIILDAVHEFLSGRSDVGATAVTLRGDIIAPTGEAMILGDGRELRIPDLPEKQVTRNTTKFFTDSTRIDIQFTRVEI